MNKIIIGAPFGNYLQFPGTTPTLGTYTLLKRAGVLGRLWRIIKTLRYNRRTQTWVNKLGLPSPGVDSLKLDISKSILSIHGFNAEEWRILSRVAVSRDALAVEFNISCPNVSRIDLTDLTPAIINCQTLKMPIIAKIPPVRWMPLVDYLVHAGFKHFHLCNTIPTPGGGMSGKPLKQYSLWAIEEVRNKYPDVTIIGGGGVTCVEDVKDYFSAGANHVAIASMLLNPFNWRKVNAMSSL